MPWERCQRVLRTRLLRTSVAILAILALGLFVCLTNRVLVAAPPLTLRIDEKPTPLKLLSVDKGGQIAWEAAAEGKPQSSQLEKLVLWGEWKEPGRGAFVWLNGGGCLVGQLLAIDAEHLTLDSDLFGELKLPLELLTGCAPNPPSDRALRDALGREMMKASGKTDRVRLENGDELTGRIGELKPDAKSIEFKGGNGPLTLELSKISFLVFNPSLAADTRPKGLFVWAGFQDGSRLPASQVHVDGKKVRAKLLGGVELSADVKALVALQPIGGGVVYLADLKPDSYRHVPYLQLAWPYEIDQSVLGGQLRCDGRVYLKGLGMHSAGRITYVLDQKYRRFESEIGVDDATGGRGSVVFRVFTDDGSGNWRDQFTSPIVRGGQPARTISIDVSGVKRMSLLVEFADHGDELDHADWLNARFVK